MKNKELVVVNAADYGLVEKKANEIKVAFRPIIEQMDGLQAEYDAIMLLDMSENKARMARNLKSRYTKLRTATGKIHKDQKQFYLQGGKYVDSWKNAQLSVSKVLEDSLSDVGDYYERLKQEERDAIFKARTEALMSNGVETVPDGLADMSEEVWVLYLAGVEASYKKKLEEEAEAEEKRLEEERLKKEEDERIKKENEQLKIKQDLIKVRAQSLFSINVSVIPDDIGDLTDDQWKTFYAEKESEYKAHLQAEAERLEKEEEEERQRKEKEEAERKEKAEADRKANEEIQRLAALGRIRMKELALLGVLDFPEDLGSLPEEAWKTFLADKKADYEKRLAEEKAAKDAEEKRLEEDRKAKAKIEKELADKKAAEEEEAKRLEDEANAKRAQGDVGLTKDLVTHLELVKEAYTFTQPEYQKMHSDVCILVDKIVGHIKKLVS